MGRYLISTPLAFPPSLQPIFLSALLCSGLHFKCSSCISAFLSFLPLHHWYFLLLLLLLLCLFNSLSQEKTWKEKSQINIFWPSSSAVYLWGVRYYFSYLVPLETLTVHSYNYFKWRMSHPIRTSGRWSLNLYILPKKATVKLYTSLLLCKILSKTVSNPTTYVLSSFGHQVNLKVWFCLEKFIISLEKCIISSWAFCFPKIPN